LEKLLVINAHPKVDTDSSVSLQVLHHFLETYKKMNPKGPIEQIDLYREHIPCIDRTFLNLQEKKGRDERLTEEEQMLDSRMSEVLQQFKGAKKYVIVMPLHNFNVPSKLKDYMDNILISKETFLGIEEAGKPQKVNSDSIFYACSMSKIVTSIGLLN
jgi:FMN-dependent NADH-azoreductase